MEIERKEIELWTITDLEKLKIVKKTQEKTKVSVQR
jgi:hypothetical protein